MRLMGEKTVNFLRSVRLPTKTAPILMGLPTLDAEKDVVLVYVCAGSLSKPRHP